MMKILVTGIGGNVGQGILRNIISLNLDIELIGVDIHAFTAGNHLCGKTYIVPFSTDVNYIPSIVKIVRDEKVDLILPSTDYEVFFLSKFKNRIKAKIVASDAFVSKIYMDKYSTYKFLSTYDIPFAKSWLPGDYDFSEQEIIAKPREGRGSRGLIINPDDPKKLPLGYMIQPLFKGVELTTAVYVTKENLLHGLFTMERKLTNGATTESKVVFQYDNRLKIIAQKMIDLGGLMGSFNIQSIVTNMDVIVPFEINCRISGSNSIRHNLGFQDVKYAIQEYLLDETPDDPKPIHGVAVRILMDVIYPNVSDFDKFNGKIHKIF